MRAISAMAVYFSVTMIMMLCTVYSLSCVHITYACDIQNTEAHIDHPHFAWLTDGESVF